MSFPKMHGLGGHTAFRRSWRHAPHHTVQPRRQIGAVTSQHSLEHALSAAHPDLPHGRTDHDQPDCFTHFADRNWRVIFDVP